MQYIANTMGYYRQYNFFPIQATLKMIIKYLKNI